MASKLNYSAEKSKLLPSVSLAASISREKNVTYLQGKDLNAKLISLNIAIPIFSGGVEYANKKLSDLAQNRKNIIDKRFMAGFEDQIELMRSKLELNERKIDYLNSEIDLNLAYYKIKYYLGELK